MSICFIHLSLVSEALLTSHAGRGGWRPSPARWGAPPSPAGSVAPGPRPVRQQSSNCCNCCSSWDAQKVWQEMRLMGKATANMLASMR